MAGERRGCFGSIKQDVAATFLGPRGVVAVRCDIAVGSSMIFENCEIDTHLLYGTMCMYMYVALANARVTPTGGW